MGGNTSKHRIDFSKMDAAKFGYLLFTFEDMLPSSSFANAHRRHLS